MESLMKLYKNKALFLVIGKDVITIRRFLLIARELFKNSIETIFLCFDKNAVNGVKEEKVNLQLDFSPSILKFKEQNFRMKSIKTKTAIIKFQEKVIFKNIDLTAPLLKIIASNKKKFVRQKNYAETLINYLNPQIIFYDHEAIYEIRIFLYVIKEKGTGIKSVCLQHAEGAGEQYIATPDFADIYIAYSCYNKDIYHRMGIHDTKIYLTGDPLNDVVKKFKHEQTKDHFLEELKIDKSKKTILVALKPGFGKFSEININLVQKIKAFFDTTNDYNLIIKPHYYNWGDFEFYNKMENIIVIQPEYPIAKLFSITDYFFSYVSSAIVESIYFKNRAFIIRLDDSGNWPAWNSFSVYKEIDFDELEKYCRLIQTNQLTTEDFFDQKNRKAFLDYFKYKYDGNCTKRVTNIVIENINSVSNPSKLLEKVR